MPKSFLHLLYNMKGKVQKLWWFANILLLLQANSEEIEE